MAHRDTARRTRRKEARPHEIIAAAVEVFGAQGFGAAKLADIARRAGIAKATIFVYFPNKMELFRAVAKTVLSAHLGTLQQAPPTSQPLKELVPLLLLQASQLGESRLPAIVRLILAESRNFPDLAQVWHDEVAAKALAILTAAISRAQACGEIRPGDPQLYAFSIIGPMLAGALFREVFKDISPQLPSLQELARQHAELVLRGLLVSP